MDIQENLSLFDDAFSIHRQIPEFQVDSNTYEQLKTRFESVQQPVLFVAYVNRQPVGYLIGYERYSTCYIWLAGVLPSNRRQGILVQLMNALQQWAIKKTYDSLVIKTRNCFKSMLLFLVSHDFKLIDIDKRDTVDSHRLILQKQLNLSK